MDRDVRFDVDHVSLSGTIQNFVAIHPDNEKFKSVEGMWT